MNLRKQEVSLAKIFTISLLVLLAITFFSNLGIVSAQEASPPTDDEINAVAKELYCPVCENVSLDVCPTQACAQWRGLIKEKLIAGWTKDEIKQYFVNQYGDRVLAEPPRTGFNWLVYILPPIFFIGGIVIVYRNLRNTKKLDINQTVKNELIDDEYLKQVEDALKSLEEKD
jgi:cytochrome c-type biogenesis protein CcmH